MGKSPAKKTHYDASIDLHGMTRPEALEAVRRFLRAHPHSSLEIIHGDGSGTLRQMVRRRLESGDFPNRGFFPGEDIGAPGLYGVTIVYT